MVRMGKTPKGWSTRGNKLKKDKRLEKYAKDPRKAPLSFQVGRVNPNVVSTFYSPVLSDLARKSAERFASHLVYFEDEKLKLEASSDSVEVDINMDGEINAKNNDAINKTKTQDDEIDWTHIDPNFSNIYHIFSEESVILEFHSQVLSSTATEFSSVTNTYKARANIIKFERLLDEKYGFARPFLTHPKVEPYVKLAQRKWATGKISFTRQNDPPLGRAASVILLFMMYRNGIRKDGVAFAALYLLVGLQPWALLILVLLGFEFVERRKKKIIPGMKESRIPQITSYYHENPEQRNEFLKVPVGSPLTSGEEGSLDEKYNSILLGDGPSALYCAALLARAGRKVLLLSPSDDASGEMSFEDTNSSITNFIIDKNTVEKTKNDTENDSWEAKIPFTVHDAKIAYVDRMQSFLAPALANDQDCQGGIRFATIGSEADGYAHDIFSVPGMGTGSIGSISEQNSSNGDNTIPYVLRAGGIPALAEDTAMFLGDGWQVNPEDVSSSISATYAKTISSINDDAGNFYMSKVTDPRYNSWWDSKSKSKKNEYRTAATRYASDFLSFYIPMNPHVRSLCAGIGMCVEDLPPSQCSMAAHVTNISAVASGEGFSFPVGGMRALGKALENVIVKNGGKVVTKVQVQDLIFEDVKEDEKGNVKEQKNNEEAQAMSDRKRRKGKEEKKDESEDKEEKKKIVAPKCLGVKLSSGTSIRVTSIPCDSSRDIEGSVISCHGFLDTFLRLTPETVRVKGGVPAGLPALKERRPQLKLLLLLKGSREKLNLPSADWWRLPNASLARDEKDPESNQIKAGTVGEMSSASSDSSIARKFTSGSSWMRVSFPSCKDPSWEERFKDRNTCVVTVEADDDFVKLFDTKPKIYVFTRANEDVKKRLVDRILKDLFQEFPQLEGKIMKLSLRGPVRMGLSHTPERYAAEGIRPKTNYPNLYVAGSDLTVDTFTGGILGSWLGASAVLKYDYLDLGLLSKTLSSDLAQFMESPTGDGEEAVLYAHKQISAKDAEVKIGEEKEAVEDKVNEQEQKELDDVVKKETKEDANVVEKVKDKIVEKVKKEEENEVEEEMKEEHTEEVEPVDNDNLAEVSK